MGRPSKFSKKLGDQICLRIAEGESLRAICQDEDMPNKSTVLRWYLSDKEELEFFRKQYDLAREIQNQLIEDECIDIADDASNDWMDRNVGEDTIRVLDHEHVQRSRLRVDTRKWKIERMGRRRPLGGESGDNAKPQVIKLVAIPKLEKPKE